MKTARSIHHIETSVHQRDELRERMREFYQTSRTYQELLAEHNEAYQRTYIALVNRYAVPYASILDLGCGNGISSRLLSQAGHRVVGTDISPLFLEHAKGWESENLTYRVCDAVELPFDAETFDVVCSNELIEHLPDVETALAEMNRVTRRGGRIIVSGPNLCSPLMPLLDLGQMMVGKPGRPVWGETKIQACRTLLKNLRLYIQKRLSPQPDFLYREPDLDEHAIGGDADSAYYANPIDLEKYFRRHGLRILKRCVGFGIKGRIMAYCLPGFSLYISMVVEK